MSPRSAGRMVVDDGERMTMVEYHFSHEHLMGTSIDIRVGTRDRASAETIDHMVVSEIERLEQIFSVFDPRSELSRWRMGENIRLSRELCLALEAACTWTDKTGGAFNPLVGELSHIWLEAEALNVVPAPETLDRAAAQIREPRYVFRNGQPLLVADGSHLNLNALAKGLIVDLARERGVECGAESLCVNAGGDLAHSGAGSVLVGIENPHRPYDNEPPLEVVYVDNAALATSGSSRRGFRISGSWYGHLIDPRSGWPADQIASASVLASDAVTADVLATSSAVQSAEEAIANLERTSGVEGLVVAANGSVWRTSGWPGGGDKTER